METDHVAEAEPAEFIAGTDPRPVVGLKVGREAVSDHQRFRIRLFDRPVRRLQNRNIVIRMEREARFVDDLIRRNAPFVTSGGGSGETFPAVERIEPGALFTLTLKGSALFHSLREPVEPLRQTGNHPGKIGIHIVVSSPDRNHQHVIFLIGFQRAVEFGEVDLAVLRLHVRPGRDLVVAQEPGSGAGEKRIFRLVVSGEAIAARLLIRRKLENGIVAEGEYEILPKVDFLPAWHIAADDGVEAGEGRDVFPRDGKPHGTEPVVRFSEGELPAFLWVQRNRELHLKQHFPGVFIAPGHRQKIRNRLLAPVEHLERDFSFTDQFFFIQIVSGIGDRFQRRIRRSGADLVQSDLVQPKLRRVLGRRNLKSQMVPAAAILWDDGGIFLPFRRDGKVIVVTGPAGCRIHLQQRSRETERLVCLCPEGEAVLFFRIEPELPEDQSFFFAVRIGEHQVPAVFIGREFERNHFQLRIGVRPKFTVEDDSRIVQFEGAVEQQVFRLRGPKGSCNGKEGKAMSQCHGSDLRRRWKII